MGKEIIADLPQCMRDIGSTWQTITQFIPKITIHIICKRIAWMVTPVDPSVNPVCTVSFILPCKLRWSEGARDHILLLIPLRPTNGSSSSSSILIHILILLRFSPFKGERERVFVASFESHSSSPSTVRIPTVLWQLVKLCIFLLVIHVTESKQHSAYYYSVFDRLSSTGRNQSPVL